MFKGFEARLKGFNLDSFLDSKIAEEQAKQAQQSKPAQRTPRSASGSRRGGARTDSPTKRPGSRLRAQDGDSTTPSKGPDPEDFVIGDDASDISRVATPRPVKEDADESVVDEKQGENAGKEVQAQDATPSSDKGKEKEAAASLTPDDELPEDVRKRLAKLDTLTTRYQDLLRNYRTAHARVTSIEPFEATLREHTPLTSITDPGALVEFLNQRSVQSEMVMQELKRMSAENKEMVKERDDIKAKLEAAEKKAKVAFDEAAGLQKEGKHPEETSDPLGVTSKTLDKDKSKTAKDDEGEEFFSYEAELPRVEAETAQHQAEIKEQQDYINELSTENASLRQDLETCRHDLEVCKLDLDATQNKVTVKEREIGNLQADLNQAKREREEAKEQEDAASESLVQSEAKIVDLQDRLNEYKTSLEVTNRELEAKAVEAEENLKKHQKEHDENLKNGKYVQREERMKEVHQNVVSALRDQAKQAEEARKIAEGRANELQFEIKRMESEADASGELITRLRGHESAAESWKKKFTEAEHERDDARRLADTKKGHEAAVASLRGQLKRAENDRDAAYQMVIDCGKCAVQEDEKSVEVRSDSASRSRNGSEATEQTGASTQPTEISTPSQSVNGEMVAPETKKKNKKKKKAKAKNATSAEPTKADEMTMQSFIDDLDSNSSASAMDIGALKNDAEKAKEMLVNGGPQFMGEFLQNAFAGMKADRERWQEDHELMLRQHKSVLEERDQRISESVRLIREKDLEISDLHHRIGEQEAAIERLDRRLKGEEELKEELETLRESLIEAGSESTDAKFELKEVREEKERLQQEFDELKIEDAETRRKLKAMEVERDTIQASRDELQNNQASHTEAELAMLQEKLEASEKTGKALQVAKESCEKQIEELKAQQTANGVESDAKHQALSNDFDDLKSRAGELERDLEAANQLAQSRFKDLTDLREHLNNVQPELKKLRLESEELKSVKAELEKGSASLKKLETKEKDLRSEIKEYKTQISGKEKEVTDLTDKAQKSDERSKALEDTCERARKDLEDNERTRDEAVEGREKAQRELKRVEEELKSEKQKLADLEVEGKKLTAEVKQLKEESELSRKQQTSSQSLMDSLQDQSHELATQLKEVKERNESMEEELADAHRLLSERGQEGETMRRLLADVESRAEKKVKDMRERMDLAVEERDRAEDEASGVGRRKARELEDLKNKLRDAERESASATEARGAVEKRERESRQRHEDLERKASQAQEEVSEVRTAMAQLRDALNEGEKQARDLDREKSEMRKTLDEREARLEKLQKSSKAMAEELRTLQASNKKGTPAPSSRSSIDSSSRVTSPAPRAQPIGQGKEVDYRYLKNVLLQFLEQREKKHQMQLVPVLGMLLHFDQADQEKWTAAISAR